MCKYVCLITSLTAVVALSNASLAQIDQSPPVAYVTVLTGSGATRGVSGPSFPTAIRLFNDRNHGLRPGDTVATLDDGTAVVLLPDYKIVVHQDPTTQLQLGDVSTRDNVIPVSLTVIEGSVHVVRKPAAQFQSDKAWLVIAGGTGPAIGYTLSKEASLVIQAGANGVTFTVTGGQATFFSGRIPGGPLIGPDDQPVDKTGVVLTQGQRISTQRPAAAETDQETPRLAWKRMTEDLDQFSLAHSNSWVERAEKGDFTPVRGEAATGAGDFGVEIGKPRQTFDQPRTTVTSPAPRSVVTAVQAPQVTTALSLIGTGNAASVIIAQKLRRSRIIGNPGTAGSGQIRFNPSAERLFELAGRSGRR